VLTLGGTIVCSRSHSFSPRDTLRALEDHKCTGLVIVGDAFARPLLEALEADPGAFDVSSVTSVVSSGMMWSDATKRGMLRYMPAAALSDGLGASEASSIAFSVMTRDTAGAPAGFAPVDAIVLDPETLQPVPAGEIGVIAKRGALPLGYLKDPEKTARTYPTIDGVRYMVGGDFARIERDGTITLLGRGSNCINTAGEKVFVEEVETALKAFPLVRDALVFGEPDPRFGQRVVALVEVSGDVGEEELIRHVQSLLAAYKAPRQVRFTSKAPRGPNGKPDYDEAQRLFREAQS
jgi:fatty-acyl-CoA synthase